MVINPLVNGPGVIPFGEDYYSVAFLFSSNFNISFYLMFLILLIKGKLNPILTDLKGQLSVMPD